MVDSVYELPLAFDVDVASSSDMKNLTPLVEDLEENHKNIHDDMDECSADKGSLRDGLRPPQDSSVQR